MSAAHLRRGDVGKVHSSANKLADLPPKAMCSQETRGPAAHRPERSWAHFLGLTAPGRFIIAPRPHACTG